MLCFKNEPVSPVSRFGVAGLLQQNRFCIFQRFRPDPMGPDGTRWDPMGPDWTRIFQIFQIQGVDSAFLEFKPFESHSFPMVSHDCMIDLWIFMDIYGMIYLGPCGPRQRPHFNGAWQRFARKAIHVSRPGDVMR